MATNEPNQPTGCGEAFAQGEIARRYMPHSGYSDQHSFPSADCCWIVLATTQCTTAINHMGGQSCCWTILATTDCTFRVGGEPCCWIVIATTNCTVVNGQGGQTGS